MLLFKLDNSVNGIHIQELLKMSQKPDSICSFNKGLQETMVL